ncbi:MAG TPA: TetR/AcrR family transcriptional regulator C-terminal domain-containing protein [Ktedonobacteraceae bacterium]|nr:TetR/AcrR family transcriptional regulator C-terminal domain-containing protein [Ktedonobacteraceae bacterium]
MQPPAIFLRFLILETLGLVEGENIIGLIRVLLPEIIHNPEMSHIPASMFQRIFAFLGNFFEAKIASGELRQFDVSTSAQVFVGSLMGFVLRRQIIHDPLALTYTHEQIAEAIVDLVLTGMLPR